MRSSKSRSRNKSNRQRTLGNIVNRVFDSSGPEGKVRGTPQQIIEKYLTLARDAQLSNDRVAEQSFFQHAEHYTRMLGEAQREQAERQQQQNGGTRDDDREDGASGENGQNQNGNGYHQSNRNDRHDRGDDSRRDDNRRDEARNTTAATTGRTSVAMTARTSAVRIVAKTAVKTGATSGRHKLPPPSRPSSRACLWPSRPRKTAARSRPRKPPRPSPLSRPPRRRSR